MDERAGLWRKLNGENLMLLNCGIGEIFESPLDCKEIQPVHPKGDQSWVFVGRTGAEAESPILWPPHAKCWLIGKDPGALRDWGQEEKGTKEDKMAGWHHHLMHMSLSKLQELVMDRDAWHAAINEVAKCWTRLSDWTELNWCRYHQAARKNHRTQPKVFSDKICIFWKKKLRIPLD